MRRSPSAPPAAFAQGPFNPLEHPVCFELPHRLTHSQWHDHIPFAFAIVSLLKPLTFVELGTHYGDSYCAFCQAVAQLGLHTRCYAVDTWCGDKHSLEYGPEVIEDLKAHHDIRYGHFSTLVRSTFNQALERFPNQSIDLLHIDGLHTYDAVKHDFSSWLPKMSQRGVILLHDICVKERDFGVWRLWDELKAQYPCIAFEFAHGLGVLAVGSSLPPNMERLFRAKEADRTAVSTFFQCLGERIIAHARHEEEVKESKRKIEDLDSQPGRRMLPWLETVRGPISRLVARLGLFLSRHSTHASLPVVIGSSSNTAPWSVARPDGSRDGAEPPFLDISVVSHNSGPWVERFTSSLLSQDYPLRLIRLLVVDHESEDDTVALWKSMRCDHGGAFGEFKIYRRPNRGFGAGHNFAFRQSRSPWFLVTNVDLEFTRDAICRVVSTALSDFAHIGSWEMRQKPYEHPKYYDPVTLLTVWSCHACALFRSDAFRSVGGYDETFFLYGEDVDLSYRLRDGGHMLRYCPQAVVWHHSYEYPRQIKPLMFARIALANGYNRLRFGEPGDIFLIPILYAAALLQENGPPGEHREMIRNLGRLALRALHFMSTRRKHPYAYPFDNWEYEKCREGPFHASLPISGASPPLVSVIVVAGAEHPGRLQQTLTTLMHQTYPNVEVIVTRPEIHGADRLRTPGNHGVFYHHVPGRSRLHAANAGMSMARGEMLMLLDNDHLLFADHVETLAAELLGEPDFSAVFGLCWGMEPALAGEGLLFGCNRLTPDRTPHPLSGTIFHRQLFDRLGGLDESLPEEDAERVLFMRYTQNGVFRRVEKTTSMVRLRGFRNNRPM